MLHTFLIVAFLVAANANAASLKRRDNGRIVGGEDAVIETYPYQVSLEIFYQHFCGGSIISERWVLTAGHCLEDFLASDLKVRAGSTYMEDGGSLHKVDKILIHENYDEREDEVPLFDIGLVRVAKPFVFDDTRQPIELFEVNETLSKGSMATVTGWGENDDDSYDGQLQSVTVPLVSKEKCNSIYENRNEDGSSNSTPMGIPEGQICAGYLGVGEKDSCQGDSGGPMAIGGRLAGIISWGEDCGDSVYPGVYTEVGYYRDWIKKHTLV